jgi:hypothetical protein
MTRPYQGRNRADGGQGVGSRLPVPYEVFGFGLADGGRIPLSRRYIESWA